MALPVYRTYSYEIPPGMASFAGEGIRILVPFKRQRVTGYILKRHFSEPSQAVKQILDVLDDEPLFPRSMIPLFNWIADYYLCPIGEVIACALPAGLNVNSYAVLALSESGKAALEGLPLTPVESAVLHRLEKGACRERDLFTGRGQPVSRTVIQTLIDRNWILKRNRQRRNGPKHLFKRYVTLAEGKEPGTFRSAVKNAVLSVLKNTPEMSTSELQRQVPSAASVLKSLEKDGYIRIVKKKVYRDPFGDDVLPEPPPILTDEQRSAVGRIRQVVKKGYSGFLLTGVTGSGKTEVYMQLAKEVIDAGRKVLILVPEIALISQVERRFRARFGECVSVLHSGLSSGERYDQWMRIMAGRAPIVIGARSAVFAPLTDIGLIVVDEEHDPSFKQEHGLMYHARDLAVKRASMEGCVVVLGSATPSIQSYYNVQTGKYTEVRLTKRVMERPMSAIQLVDLRKTRDFRGFRKFISPQLQTAMQETLARDQQVLLFLNRRGFSNISVCGTCGEAVKCRNCEISMTLHQRYNAYKCHYCGFSCSAKTDCPVCGSSHIRHLGIGTEKLEETVKRMFPSAEVARIDRDTTRKKGALRKILQRVRDNTVDILVGTQMVAKGHDFPNITLVGIICADLSLNFPDFRSGVRTFQLLAQVAGRAGRGDSPGNVILQTYHPGHFSISAALHQDFLAFYHKDLTFRSTLNYPPFSRLIQFRITGRDYRQTKEHAFKTGKTIQSISSEADFHGRIAVLGPIESPISRIAGDYRWQILLKGSRVKPLHQAVSRMLTDYKHLFNNRQVRVGIDVDPHFMM
ncbi:MAG: primosomal protein N' [Desulfobacterales bacterium]